MRKKVFLFGLATAVSLLPVAAGAQRAPDYQQARASGAVGEQVDGYLGFPQSPSAQVQALASDINIKRRAVYTKQAAANRSTVEEFAFTAGCNLIAKTKVGEKYQAPDGSWQTRTGAAPIKHPRCP